MTYCDCLSLTLIWCRTCGSCVRSLTMIFGQASKPFMVPSEGQSPYRYCTTNVLTKNEHDLHCSFGHELK